MRLLASFAAVAAALASAEILAPADITTMQETFDHIFTGIDNMVVNINKFKAEDAAGVQAIIGDSNIITKAINDGTAKIKKSQAMALPDLLAILGPVMVMENKVGEVVDALSARKADLEKVGASKAVLQELVAEKAAADGLVAAILANLPMSSVVGVVAKPIAAMITNRLDKGVKEWGGTSAPAAAAPPRAKGTGGRGGLLGGLVEGLLGGKGPAVPPMEFTERFLQELKKESETRG